MKCRCLRFHEGGEEHLSIPGSTAVESSTMNYKTIKVSDNEYNMIVRARTELANRGLRSLDDHPQVRNNAPSDLQNFALGAIVGLGAAALLALLIGGDEE